MFGSDGLAQNSIRDFIESWYCRFTSNRGKPFSPRMPPGFHPDKLGEQGQFHANRHRKRSAPRGSQPIRHEAKIPDSAPVEAGNLRVSTGLMSKSLKRQVGHGPFESRKRRNRSLAKIPSAYRLFRSKSKRLDPGRTSTFNVERELYWGGIFSGSTTGRPLSSVVLRRVVIRTVCLPMRAPACS